MKKTATITVGLALAAVLALGSVGIADEHEEAVKKDLFAVITLEGHPCGVVTSFTRQGEADYIVVCQTGDRYHVRLVPEGRVSVQKL
ncbi:MAG: hypothetical protein AB7G75_07845 [Candidatus Binatia bacterium]